MPRKWQAIAWSRELPKPIRNGRFYELGHKVAIILAGHAHQDGTGITVGPETLAREAWCTHLEAMEALKWLEDEKWFIRSQGPKGTEWECNPDVSRSDVDELEEKATYTRLRKAKNMRDMRERKRLAKLNCNTAVSVTVHGNAPVTQSGHTDTFVTGDSDQRDRGPLPVLPGSVTDSGHASGHTRRSEPRKTHKTHEDPREDPKTRSTAAASDAPLTLVDPIPTEQKPAADKPEAILAKAYYDAMEGNVKFLAVRGIVKAALTKYPFEDVKRGIDQLASEPAKPLTKQTLWNAMKDHQSKSRFRAFQSSDFDYDDHGDFGVKHGA